MIDPRHMSFNIEDPLDEDYDAVAALWTAVEGLTAAVRLLQQEQDRRYLEIRETVTQLERALLKMGARFE